ncbi:MAG: 4'-phosphopantetheinyl transferase family protein [Pseudomonadota bacterium]
MSLQDHAPPHLRGDEVQLWRFFYEDAWAQDPLIAADYEALITPDERQRMLAFRFEKDQRQYLAARALVRTTLSLQAGIPPAEWRFGATARGKPFIEGPAGPTPLHFNLAHTHGLVVCAVSTAHARLGVDVESIDRRTAALDIADSHFSPAERAWLRGVPAGQLHQAFMQLWTLKEAWIKATGEGLSAELSQCTFALPTPPVAGPAAVPATFHGDSTEQGTHWRFIQAVLQDRFAVAVGADTQGRALNCRVFDTVPLRRHAERPELAFTAA